MSKFKRVQSIILTLVMLLSLFSGANLTSWADTPEAYTGQTGTGSYTISTAAQLAKLAGVVNTGVTYEGSTFTLTDDIDLAKGDSSGSLSWTGGTEWTPIALYKNGTDQQDNGLTGYRFQGTFDGAEHYIKNIFIDKLASFYNGYALFGAIGEKGTVENLGVTGTVGSCRCGGGIAGHNYGTISHCFSDVAVTEASQGGTRGAGGIVGHNEGTVEYCINAGTVHNNNNRAGGIVGFNYGSSAKIDHCFSVGMVTSANKGFAGAIAATNGDAPATAGTITKCYYLTGSAEATVGLDNGTTKAIVTAFNADGLTLDSGGVATTTKLKDALNSDVSGTPFIDAVKGNYPVLSWQSGYKWTTLCTVAIEPATGGTFTAKAGGIEITGSSNRLADGTEIELTASAPEDGYIFNGFTAKTGGSTINLGGAGGAGPYTKTFTVDSDVILSASYLSAGDITAVDFCGVDLSLNQMKAHPTTAVFTMVKGGAPQQSTVTGITVADILKYYAPDVKPAALKFEDSTGYSSTVYNCDADTTLITGYDWSQTMLAWSQLDSSGKEQIRAAVNGGKGSLWVSGVTKVTAAVDAALVIKSEEGVFPDRFVSLDQLKEHSTTDTSGWLKITSKGPTTYDTITGIAIKDLISSYMPYSSKVTSMAFSNRASNFTSSTFEKSKYSGNAEGLDGSDFDNGMLVWSSNVTTDPDEEMLYSALNGGIGKFWATDVATVSVSTTNIVSFSVTPKTAAIEVKDSGGSVVQPASEKTYNLPDAAYILPDGTYTYTATASGYTDKAGSITVSGNSQAVTVALEKTSGGGDNPGGGGDTGSTYSVTGYSGKNGSVTAAVSSAKAGDTVTLTVAPSKGYVLTNLSLSSGTLKESVTSTRTAYTFTMPSSAVTVTATFEKVELAIYTQKGEKGASETAALFSRSQLEDMATTPAKPSFGYVFYKDNVWRAVVPIQYVTLDQLLASAGVSFSSGDSISANASDFQDTISYKNLQSHQYYFDPNNNGKKTTVPYIITLQHVSDTLSGSSLEAIAKSGTPTTNLRSCYGCSEEEYTGHTAMGRRLVSSVTSLTIIKSATVNSNTKDGVEPSQSETATVIEAKVTVSGGKGKVSISEKDVETAINAVSKNTVLQINAVSKDAIKGTDVTLAGSALSTLADNSLVKGLKIITNTGSISFDATALDGIDSKLSGGSVSFSVGLAETSAMTEAQKALAGSHVVYELSVSTGDKKIENFGGTATVTLPYKLSAGEDAKNIVVYCLGSDGKVERFQGTYDSSEGMVTFTTSHFSIYMPVVEATAAFSDVLLTDWFYNSANYAVKKGLMVGTSGTTFEPNTKTTRAMFVTILWRLQGQEKPAMESSPFTDVADKNAWYYDAVLWAYGNDIAKGMSSDRFAPTGTLSRQEMVTILHRFAQKYNSKLTEAGAINGAQFSDWSSTSSWAKESMEWAYANKLVGGTSDTTLSPNGNATRAQLAEILMRYQ